MDENQNIGETVITTQKNEKIICEKHDFWRCLLCGLMVFLGAFCAFYVVTDWHYKTMMRMKHKLPYARQMEEAARAELREMDAFMGKESKKMKKVGNIIHLQNTGNEYRIIVDLRAFDNNENNLEIKTNNNILTIIGRTVKKSKENEQISEFQQSYLFGRDVRLEGLTKNTYGNYYVISIPIQKNNEDDEG